MISVQNPIVFCRKIVNTIKGVERRDEWKVYMAVAFLSMAASCLFVFYGGYVEETPKSISGGQHIVLPLDELELKINFRETEEEPIRRAEVKEVTAGQSSRVATSGGDWYYDEIHKDWRYQ